MLLYIYLYLYYGLGFVYSEKCGESSRRLGSNGFHFYKFANATSLGDCVNSCCSEAKCELAFLLDLRCFGLSCQRKPEICRKIADQLINHDKQKRSKQGWYTESLKMLHKTAN